MSFEQFNILLLIDIFLLIYCDWSINVIGNYGKYNTAWLSC